MKAQNRKATQSTRPASAKLEAPASKRKAAPLADDKPTPSKIEKSLRDIARFVADPPNGRIETDLWPQTLTLGQALYQCGYLMRTIIRHPDTPPDVRSALNTLVSSLRESLAAKDEPQLQAIDAGVMFAQVALALCDGQSA